MPVEAGNSLVPFRLIAIVCTEQAIDDVFRLASLWPDIRFGLMLRDPLHRRDAVERLAAYALALDRPDGITLITNSSEIQGINYLHRTSAQLREMGEMKEENAGTIISGFSTHDESEAAHAVAVGAHYLTFSPVFPTPSKPGHPGAGIDMLARICRQVPLPVFALGGITAADIPLLLSAGTYGIASISLFAPDGRDELEAVIGEFKRIQKSEFNIQSQEETP